VLRSAGVDDPREDALRYLARSCYPALYRPNAPRFGVPEPEYELLAAYFDRGIEAIDGLRDMGAVDVRAPFIGWDESPAPDYHSHFSENALPRGRGVSAVLDDGGTGTGRALIEHMKRFADSRGVRLKLRHQAVALVTARDGSVEGVVCRTPAGIVSIRARGGVIFGSGGITHDATLRRRLLRGPVAGGAGCLTNTGDLIAISGAVGASVGMLSSGFWNQQVADFADDLAPTNLNVWYVPGDGVLLVNRYGVRVVNEKCDYHNRGRAHHVWEDDEYPNQLLFMVYDQRTADRYAGAFPIPPAGTTGRHVIVADDLAGIEDGLARHLLELARFEQLPVPEVSLNGSFAESLRETIRQFNAYALNGRDLDYQRGEHAIDPWAHGPPAPDNDLSNPTMYPLSDTGPYYAIVIVGSAFETKAGPRIDPEARMLHASGEPIPGLYGAGNCTAGVLGESYTGGGASIGPALIFGYLAGQHAAARVRA
jgi:3-oxosteroid 1-dehydrogenase